MDANEMYVRLRDDAERLRVVDQSGQAAKRIVSALQTACDYIDSSRDWAYTYRTFEVPVTTGTQPLYPTTLKNLGINGAISRWLTADPNGPKQPIFPMTMWEYNRVRASGRRGLPVRYAPGEGVNESADRYFFLFPLTDRDIDIDIHGRRRFPRFEFDGTLADPDAPITNPNVLLEIPEQWHDLVIFQWAFLFLMRDKGSAQTRGDQKGLADSGLKLMQAQERNGREQIHHLPAFGEGYL